MKIMILTPYLPHRRVGHGGGTAVRGLVTWLARGHRVLVVSLLRPGEEDLLDQVRELGAEAMGIPFRDQGVNGPARMLLATDRALAAAAAMATGFPFYIRKYWSPRVARRIRAAAASFAPDAIQIEYLQLGLYGRDLRSWRGSDTRPRLILNSHELGSVPRERHAALATNPITRLLYRWEAGRWRNYQVAASTWADRTLCVTPEDHALYAAMGGRNLVTMPLGMDTEAIACDWHPEPPERHLFMGSFQHGPNRSAAEFLLTRVWPQLHRARPGAGLLLAGRGSREFLSDRGSPPPAGVEALGFVDDLEQLFRSCRLFVAPLTEGGGIKIKILEAMARGLPVVTSPVGAEGITTDPNVLTVAPCDDSFATGVLAAAADMEACRRRSAAARLLIEEHFSWRSITERLTALYRD